MVLLEVRNVVKSFGGLRALQDVSLSVAKGEIRAVIGPNGAGKSTFFNVMTGLLKPDSGDVGSKGNRSPGCPPTGSSGKGSAAPSRSPTSFRGCRSSRTSRWPFFPITARAPTPFRWRENSRVGEEVLALLDQVGLVEKHDSSASVLSHGDQKRLEIAISLASRPKLLMLDEPTAGMSRFESRETVALLQRISREQGLTLIFTEHDMDIVFGISEKIMVLQQGAVIADGTPAEIKANPEVRKAYLGEEITES
jgi:ABC-type branched-chain amino acid transport systems, ATPase component